MKIENGKLIYKDAPPGKFYFDKLTNKSYKILKYRNNIHFEWFYCENDDVRGWKIFINYK